MGIPVGSLPILANSPSSQWLPFGSGRPMSGEKKCGYTTSLYTTQPATWTRYALPRMLSASAVDHGALSDAISTATPPDDARKAVHGTPMLHNRAVSRWLDFRIELELELSFGFPGQHRVFLVYKKKG